MPYSSMEDVSPTLKGIKPPITLAQANAIAAQADKLEEGGEVESGYAVAIASFKKGHVAKGGKWVKKEGSEYGKKSLLRDIVGRLKATIVGSRQSDDRPDFSFGVKAIETDLGKHIVLWTSNAYIDREEEIVSLQAWKDYVDRVDNHPVLGKGQVWFWHVKGSDHADIVWQDVLGRFLVEVAKVDDTPRGEKMFHALQHPEEFPDLLPQGWGTSHGYLWKKGHKKGGVYDWIHKFETTVLPKHRASNLLGGIKEVFDMSVSKEKMEALVTLFGEQDAKSIVEEPEKATALLDLLGLEHKEEGAKGGGSSAGGTKKKKGNPVGKAVSKKRPAFLADEDEDEDDEDEDEDEEGEEKEAQGEKGEKEAFYELEMDDDLLAEIAKHVDVKGAVVLAVKEILPDVLGSMLKEFQGSVEAAVKEAVGTANVESKEQIVQQALAGTLKLVPFSASESDDNVVSAKEVVKLTGEKARGKKDPVKVLVARMMEGVA